MPPRFWLLQVDWLLLAAILSPPLVVRVCGQWCPPYYTVPPSWCTKNPTEEERRAYHDQPLPYNCSDAAWVVEDPKNYNVSVTLTEQDFLQCSEDTYEECCPVFKTLAANISLTPGDWTQNPLHMCLGLEAPQSMNINISWKAAGDQWTTAGNRLLLIIEIYNLLGHATVQYDKIITLKTHPTLFETRYRGNTFEIFIQSEAVPALAQLHTFCYADNEGYIQTPEWNGHGQDLQHIDNCVTVVVPHSQAIMISFIGMGLLTEEMCKSLYLLTVHLNADCRGDGEKICTLADFSPRVFEGVRSVSLRFTTRDRRQWSGVRLLYSFHPRSAKPEKLTNGKWNCSVLYFSDFQDHFLCSSQKFCLDNEDRFQCTVGQDLCSAVNSNVEKEGICYMLFNGRQSWNDAAWVCEQHGGHLSFPNSVDKMRLFLDMTGHGRWYTFFTGLKKTSNTTLEIYQNTLQWANDTLFVIQFKNYRRFSQNCFALRYPNILPYLDLSIQAYLDFNVSMLARTTEYLDNYDCDGNREATFICEVYLEKAKENDHHTKRLLPKLPAGTLDWTMAKCDHNQIAHVFLACDVDTNCSAHDDGATSVCAKTKFTPAMPLFTCNNGAQRIPYSLVCDHRSDCCDSSDEDFCQFPACAGRNVFVCKNKQCISSNQRCDNRRDCLDESDESLCSASLKHDINFRQGSVLPPAVVNFTNRSTITVKALNSSSCPETHFQCPGNGYCMPVYVLCNGVFDCPGMEDEQGCDAFTCPGFYRCRASRICLHHDHLCDDVFQCPQHDDELLCNFTCPVDCICYGYAFICSDSFPTEQYLDLRYLEAPYTSMKLSNMSRNRFLLFLDLRHCNIDTIGSVDLPNLQNLDLSYNRLEAVTVAELIQFNNLRVLSLAYNPLVSVYFFMDGVHVFNKLIELNLAGLRIIELNESFPDILPNVYVLNFSNTGLDKLSESGFQSFPHLRQLDLHGCPMQTFSPGVFDGLSQLSFIRTENYKLCCSSVLPDGFDANNCEAPTNEVSSCDALLRSDAFRVFLTLYALLSLVGNLASFLYRTVLEKTELKLGFEIFVTHLCVADFLMGVYLAIIGVADRVYYGDYRWNDVTWRHSTACKVAGVLSLLSSEVSAFLICIITLERFLVIRFPLKNLRFRRWSAHAACLGLWILGLLLATVPLLPNTTHWEFYSQSGICVPLPITRKEFPGGDYAFGVVIGLNFVLFVMIAVGQLLIYVSVKANSMPAQDSRKKSKDMAIARRLLAVVMTDFLCWFPIGVLGILAKIGVPIPGDVNVVIAIFVLPFNSALNPFLYTFNMVMERRQKVRQQRLAKEDKTELQSTNVLSSRVTTGTGEFTTNTNDDVWKLFEGWLEDGALSADRVRHFLSDVSPAKAAACSSEHPTYTEDDAWKLLNGWLENGVLSADRVRRRIVNNTCT